MFQGKNLKNEFSGVRSVFSWGGSGVVARKLTFSNKVSELLDGAPPAPRWLFHYITVTSHAAVLSRTVIVDA